MASGRDGWDPISDNSQPVWRAAIPFDGSGLARVAHRSLAEAAAERDARASTPKHLADKVLSSEAPSKADRSPAEGYQDHAVAVRGVVAQLAVPDIGNRERAHAQAAGPEG